MNPDVISAEMAPYGLMVRGGFHPGLDDLVPALADGKPVGTVVIVGNAGPAMWEKFSGSPERRLSVDPLNTWTRRVVSTASATLGAHVLYPFDGPPYYPFQGWARRAEPVWSSPIGILIHPEYGLWHGYRAALMFEEQILLPPRLEVDNPCDTCVERPCLTTCPVFAFTGESYEVPSCINHISTQAGGDCISLGCRARRACPIGVAFRYDSPQADFHQQAFLLSHTGRQVES